MKTLLARLSGLLGITALACCCLTGAFAQDDDSEMKLNNEPPKGKFVILPPRLSPDLNQPLAPSLPTWNGSFVFSGTTYNYNMVGTAPSTNTSTTVAAYIIPIKIVITNKLGKKTTFDPSHVLPNGNSVTTNTVDSPIFDSSTTYTQGGVNVGTTQYIDAFQRANFWGTVSTNTNYHLLLGGPTVLPEQTLSPPSRFGKTGKPFGSKVGLVDINWFDAQLHTIIASFSQLQPNTLPIFLTYDVYLTQGGGCCIGGYHSSEGSPTNPQAYSHFTYIDHAGQFAQDVSALSHEVGEWADDPLVVHVNGNNTPCGILEVGDPLENGPNFGGFPYVLHGFTYNLQDLVTLPYFGAPTSTSVNNWLSFQHASLSVCSNGP
jgi:hypothetical protein